MDRYMVISPHTSTDCADVLKQFLYIGYITHFDWGCGDGDHTGYAIIEAQNEKEASLVVPPTQREKTRVIHLKKYSPEEVLKFHRIT